MEIEEIQENFETSSQLNSLESVNWVDSLVQFYSQEYLPEYVCTSGELPNEMDMDNTTLLVPSSQLPPPSQIEIPNETPAPKTKKVKKRLKRPTELKLNLNLDLDLNSESKSKLPELHPFSSSKQLECPVCKKEWKTRRYLRRHYATHSPTRETFNCGICAKPFINKIGARRHEITHMSQSELKGVQTAHLECTFCLKWFFDRTLYDRHLKVHTGLKPYSCPVCDSTFKQRFSMKRHIKQFHDEYYAKALLSPMTPTTTPSSPSLNDFFGI